MASKMSELRIFLLGNNAAKINRVGNIILGRDAFETEYCFPSVEQHSRGVVQEVEGRLIRLIITPHLYHTELLQQEIRSCVSLSDSGPHAFLLVTKKDSFTQEEGNRLKHILDSFSDQAHKYAIVITVKRKSPSPFHIYDKRKAFYDFIALCSVRHYRLAYSNKYNDQKAAVSQLFEEIDRMLKENGGSHLTCNTYEDAQEDTSHDEERQALHEERITVYNSDKKKKSPLGIMENITNLALTAVGRKDTWSSQHPKLNLVLCGRDETVKASISDLILGQREQTAESSSVCVKREGEVCGHLLTLVEMPALYNTQLSEEEVICQTVHYLSLCNPGVHAFLFIIPVGPLHNKDKGELEKIQRIFGSKVMEHMVVIFASEKADVKLMTEFTESSSEMKKLVGMCGMGYRVIETKARGEHKEVLMAAVKTHRSYSLQTYVKAQQERVCKMENEIQELKRKLQNEGNEEEQSGSEGLRVVLIGKTGNGKSATGNTILGRTEFETEACTDSVTTVCQKAFGEIEGRSIAVVDTPGLFDTTLSNDHVQQELVKCISMLAPGPHVFIIVLSVGRITKEELDTLDLINMIFGPKAPMFSIVLFTRGEDLGNKSIQEYIERSKTAQLKKLIRDCGDRYVVFKNNEKNDRTQVHKLLKIIQTVKKSNRGQYFTNEMFEEAELSIKKKVEEILKEREREIEAEKKELEEKYSREMEKLKETLEEEKQKADLEKQKMEKVFKEKEEALKQEFEQKEQAEKKKWEMEDMARSEEEKNQKAKWQQKIEELEEENKKQRNKFVKELQERDEEDKRREERYRQDEENLKCEQMKAMEELKEKQKDELKRRESEENRNRKKDEEERQCWEKKIKEAEYDRKEVQEDLKRKQKEWEEEKKRQLKEREEKDLQRKHKHAEELRAKEEEQDRMREKFENEREQERVRREEERQQWREEERKKIEQKEREYEEKKHAMENEMRKKYEQLEQMRKEEWERRKREDDERREEEQNRLKKLKEEIETERQEDIKKRVKEDRLRQEREEKEREEMKKDIERKMKELQHKYEDEARKKAEEFNDFKNKSEKHFQDLIAEHQKKYELLERLYHLTEGRKGEEIKNLRKELDELKNKTRCVII